MIPAERTKQWIEQRKREDPLFQKKENTRLRKLKIKQRFIVLSYYSNRTTDEGNPTCNCCGEDIIQFLEIDHINGDGNKHRKELGYDRIEGWLIRNNFPEGFQVLCCNCNKGKQLNGGKCPHEGY